MNIKKDRFLLTHIVVLLVLAGFATWWFLLRQPPLPEGIIQANGRIEGDHYLVAGKMPGRVAELLAQEGDTVQKGQVLLRLDAAQVDARVEQARQAVGALENLISQVLFSKGVDASTANGTKAKK
jgi:HlyD family secretion protein